MGTKAMTSYDANGAPVETEATAVRRIRLRAGLREVTPGGEIEPLFEEYVLGEDHLAAIQRLSEQLAAAKRECSELQSRLGPPHPYKDGCYCSPCCIERLSTALAAERERGGLLQADFERLREWASGALDLMDRVVGAGRHMVLPSERAARREGGGE